MVSINSSSVTENVESKCQKVIIHMRIKLRKHWNARENLCLNSPQSQRTMGTTWCDHDQVAGIDPQLNRKWTRSQICLGLIDRVLDILFRITGEYVIHILCFFQYNYRQGFLICWGVTKGPMLA